MATEPEPGDDPRWHRTESALRRALVELCAQTGPAAVTVPALVRQAGIGRATFYRHHHDVAAFVDAQREQMLTRLKRAFQHARHEAGPDPGRYVTLTVRIKAALQVVHENAELFTLLSRGPEGTVFRTRCRALLAELFAEDLDWLGIRVDADYCPPEYVSAFVVHATLGVIGTWLAKPRPEPIEDVTFFLVALISGGAEFLRVRQPDDPGTAVRPDPADA